MKTSLSLTFEKEKARFLDLAEGMRAFCSIEEIAQICNAEKSLFSSVPQGEARVAFLLKILKEAWEESARDTSMMKDDIVITSTEVQFLHNIEDVNMQRAMFAFLLWRKSHPHESGWIRFDAEGIGEIAKQVGASSKFILTELVAEARKVNMIDMRVIGSKSPILCYSLPWDNVLVTSESETITFNTQEIKTVYDKFIKRGKT